MKISDVRHAIALLQVFPLIVCAVSVLDSVLDLSGICLSDLASPFFGVSLLPLYFMWRMSASLNVSQWSIALYISLFVSTSLLALSNILGLSEDMYALHEAADLVLYTGIIASFVTYLCGKYNELNNRRK